MAKNKQNVVKAIKDSNHDSPRSQRTQHVEEESKMHFDRNYLCAYDEYNTASYYFYLPF